jgi:hypothetical protein
MPEADALFFSRSGMEMNLMATYKEISSRVAQTDGFVPKTCWIAHVMADNHLTKRAAPNRIDPNTRQQPCPRERWTAIENALRYFGMI